MINSGKRIRLMVVVVLLGAILLHSAPSQACGPFTLSAVFTFTVHPEYPLENFARGELGILQPTYARSYLYVAFRHLSGAGFQPSEQQALVSLWQERLNFAWRAEGQDWVKEWLIARGKVPAIAKIEEIEVFRSRERPNEYESYLNCTPDAFQTAVNTLNERIIRFGADSPVTKDWVTAQDQVFANCSGGTTIPESAASAADPLVISDRQYQIAAAYFYAGQFWTARQLFESIAQDKASPWKRIAGYLVTRTLVREASIGPAGGKQAALASAEQQLRAILEDAQERELHSAARRLLDLVLLRSKPAERTIQLGILLTNKGENPSIKQHLWDYTMLLDHWLGNDEPMLKVPESVRADELTDWVVTFQEMTPSALRHAVEKWESSRSLAWLIAALSKVTPNDAVAGQLLDAASEVEPSSPGFATVSFHAVRMAIESGKTELARARLDELLTHHRNRLSSSSINGFTSLRLLLAPALDDFLKHAQRVPVAFSWDDDGREIPAENSELSDANKGMHGKPLFDVDARILLNERFPLDIWRQAAASSILPVHLRRDVAQAAWLRAVLLDDLVTADVLARTVSSQLPELATNMDEYIQARQPDAKRFSAIYTWLKFPGLEPVVDAGLGRQESFGVQDTYRDNWWCTATYIRGQPELEQTAGVERLKISSPLDLIQSGKLPPFLTSTQAATGQSQWTKLKTIGAAPNYLCREVIRWASKSPGDPRVPEALHLAVRSTRYGCTNQETARWSKAAFAVLHQRFPKSIWAKRTPYWFKD